LISDLLNNKLFQYSFSDYNEFLDDLEEDPDMRTKVNIYKDSKKLQIPVDVNDMVDPSAPQITLEEMLDDLVLDDVEMADA
jgi:nonsense-mediated mRNA decay protein 3